MPLTVGTRLGPYEILAALGAGGMGEVFRARDTRLDRVVALKILPSDRGLDEEARQRFAQEARLASSLNHPNIVTVFDVGKDGDIEFIAMELVPGHPLDQRIPAAGLSVRDLLQVAIPIAAALAKAHSAGLVHRDLKPANVMITDEGIVKVLDFGLAKSSPPPDAGLAATMALQTARGIVLGTSAYMSPEQAEARPVDARSDIFSFGVMLYEMAAGRRPFAGDSQAAVIAAVLRETPKPIGEVRPDIPSELARLITRCLNKDPERRVQSMADLRVALTEIKEETDSGRLAVPLVSPRMTASRSAGWIAAAAATLITALVVWQVARGTSSQTDPPLEPVPLTNYPGDEATPAWSPDGSQFAFMWNGEHQDNLDIYVQAVGSNAPLRLTTDPRGDFGPAWSPDGRYIAFLRWTDSDTVAVQLVSPLGGPERHIGQFFTRQRFNRPLAGVCWSADSRFLLVSGAVTKGQRHGIYRLAIDTGDVMPLATVDDESEGYVRPALSFDGRTLAMLHLGGAGSIVLLSLSSAVDGRNLRTLDTSGRSFSSLAWGANGRDLIGGEGGNTPTPLYRVPLAGGTPETLSWSGAAASNPAVSPARRRLAFVRVVRDTNIWEASLDRPDRARPDLRKLAASSFREVAPQYSPDGQRLAFHSNRSGSVQVWTADADGSRPVQVTSMDVMATTGTPRWSPDGQSIAFDSTAGGNTHVYVIAADGGRPRPLTHGSSQNYVAAWSHDGRWIYFTSTRSGQRQIWRAASAGGEPEPVTRDGGEAPTVSPDGEWLYFTRGEGADGLWKMPSAGGTAARVVENLFRYDYAVGAAGVYWVPAHAPSQPASVLFRDVRTGGTVEILKITKPADLGLALSPDGRHLLFTQVDYSGQDLMLVENFR